MRVRFARLMHTSPSSMFQTRFCEPLRVAPTGYFLLAFVVLSSACYGRVGPGLFWFAADTALLTAVIVSATAPPPPLVIYAPEPRHGYAWQPGYWTIREGEWVWVEGGWVALREGYAWAPAHWDRLSDGTWQLVPGRWVRAGPPPPAPLSGPPA